MKSTILDEIDNILGDYYYNPVCPDNWLLEEAKDSIAKWIVKKWAEENEMLGLAQKLED